MAFRQFASAMQIGVIEGGMALVWAPRERLVRALKFMFQSRVARAEIAAGPERLASWT
jgi:hypothetical protein